MKIVHVPFTFAPDPIGGTEIYVKLLAKSLQAQGIDSLIAAPCERGAVESYEHDGLHVRRFASSAGNKHLLRELYGEGDPEAAGAFGQILDEECPDAVHVHAFTRTVSLLLVRAVRRRGLPVFFTYHTPTVSCQRGTLMLRGREPCDGVLEVKRCTSCSLEGQGVPAPAADLLSHVPDSFAHLIERMGLTGGIWTALRMANLIGARHASVHALLHEVNGVVALREWVRALLVRNGVPSSKIILSKHGLPKSMRATEPLIDVEETPLRVAFFGRADPMKGAETLIEAVKSLPDLAIELHLYGVIQSTGEYWPRLKCLVGQDRRINFLSAVPHEDVVPLLCRYHLLAVPSRWLETGPLVILEAFAAGTPVIGANLGGIAELIRDQQNGLLVPPEDAVAWANALSRCARDRALLANLRRNVQAPRGMGDVADEMSRLYKREVASEKYHSEQPLA